MNNVLMFASREALAEELYCLEAHWFDCDRAFSRFLDLEPAERLRILSRVEEIHRKLGQPGGIGYLSIWDVRVALDHARRP